MKKLIITLKDQGKIKRGVKMKRNNEKRKWYFLIAVALIVGALIGYFATSHLSAKGNASYLNKQTNVDNSDQQINTSDTDSERIWDDIQGQIHPDDYKQQ